MKILVFLIPIFSLSYMDNKYTISSQQEINSIMNFLERWKKIFSIKIQYFIDGWSISLTELTLYPRLIVIAKFNNCDYFEIKSFEVELNRIYQNEYKEIFALNRIKTKERLFKEIKEIIYGKDLFNNIKKQINKIKS